MLRISVDCIYEQVIGEISLKRGGTILLRGFGRFNLDLWDDVLEELQPITKEDIIMVNFGAWYHRFFFNKGSEEWAAWQQDVRELLFERLQSSPAQV